MNLTFHLPSHCFGAIAIDILYISGLVLQIMTSASPGQAKVSQNYQQLCNNETVWSKCISKTDSFGLIKSKWLTLEGIRLRSTHVLAATVTGCWALLLD